MAEMFGMCGLDCAACPAQIAYKADDDALRAQTAAEWSKQFGVEIKPEDINCVGCLTLEGPHIGHCSQCEMRKCGLARNLTSCGLCDDYPCETLAKFLDQVPPARANLETLRQSQQE